MKRILPSQLGIFLLGCLFTINCATIIAPGPDKIPINTNPTGAEVLLDGKSAGLTPTTLLAERDSEGLITIRKAGYEDVIIDRDKVLNGWLLGNIILGGLIGVTIDLITHNQGKYSDEPLFVRLKTTDERVPTASQTMTIPMKRKE